MKKVFVLLLVVLYGASSFGATINMHYCMDKFAGFSLTESNKEKCPKCGMANTGCCKDKKKQLKLSIDQQKSGQHQINYSSTCIVLSAFYIHNIGNAIAISKQNLAYLHGPPILIKQDTQATLSVFII